MKAKWIVLIVVASLVLAAAGYLIYRIVRVSAAYTPPETSAEDNANAWGDSFAPRLLGKLGYNVKVHRLPYQRDAYSLIIRRYRDKDELETWRAWLGKDKRLVLLCREGEADSLPRPLASTHDLMRSVKALSIDTTVTLDGFPLLANPAWRETVLAAGDAALIMREKTEAGGDIIYIADNSVFRDRNMILGDNLYLLNNCLKGHYHTPIAFDFSSPAGTESGDNGLVSIGEQSDVFFLFRGNFLFLFLQLLFLGLFFILVFWKRFGPVRDTEQFARRSLLRHLEATGNFFEKTANPLVVVDILDRYFLSRLRELLRLVSGSRTDLAAEVARRLPAEDRSGKPGEDVFALNLKANLAARDHYRERIILKLKGVDKKHGKNKNPG